MCVSMCRAHLLRPLLGELGGGSPSHRMRPDASVRLCVRECSHAVRDPRGDWAHVQQLLPPRLESRWWRWLSECECENKRHTTRQHWKTAATGERVRARSPSRRVADSVRPRPPPNRPNESSCCTANAHCTVLINFYRLHTI